MKRYFLSLIPAVFVLALLVPHVALAQVEPLTLDAGWQYRWGDSPFTSDGVPQWTLKSVDQDSWSEIDFPSNPPERAGQRNVWYRTVLPDGDWRDPVIYIYSVDLIVEAYLDGKRIYNYGTFDEEGQGRFEGWPWHMINLPSDFAGKTINFRIFSTYSDIGLWGEVMLMERLDLINYIVDNSLDKIAISSLTLLIALVALLFAIVQSSRQMYLLISLFTFASSVMLFAQSQVKQFLYNAPLLWDQISATAYFSLPIAMALLFGSWCQGKFTKLIKGLALLHAAFLVFAIGGSLAGALELSTMYLIFDALLTVSLIILFIIAFSQFRLVQNEVRVAIGTFAIFSLFLLADMAVAHNILPWTRMPLSWGLLLFAVTMVAISLRHFTMTQNALIELNETLEHKVQSRTKDLERLASIDPLTGLINRRAFYSEADRAFQSSKRYGRDLSLLMMDIDYFKQFNDTYGHAVGDSVLVAVARCFRKVCRETDLPARFGGEEFIVLLEEADQEAAMNTAERLREAIGEIEIPDIDKKITASLGVSRFEADTKSLDELILRADKAMYKAKAAGRNNSQFG